MNFTDFGFKPLIEQAITATGFETPTPVQQQCIPLILKGNDLIACAQTGTGKTAAYVLPMLDMLHGDDVDSGSVEALVIAPTRELAMQIDQQFEDFAWFTDTSSIAVYGGGTGADFEAEKRALSKGAKIIVATPGRLISHLNMGYCNFKGLRFLVLDEADQMLNMGFMPDILKIISFLPKNRQTLMFSATMPDDIRKLARNVLKNPSEINLAVSKPADNIIQKAYFLDEGDKKAKLLEILKDEELVSILLFSSTKSGVKDLERELIRLKMNAMAIHSDLEQEQRKEVLRKFRNRDIRILVATDIVSRGIDIENISLVLNYNVPQDAEDYVHRVGRTARAEKTGMAITFVNDRERRNFQNILKLTGSQIEVIQLSSSERKPYRETDSPGQRQNHRKYRKPQAKDTGRKAR